MTADAAQLRRYCDLMYGTTPGFVFVAHGTPVLGPSGKIEHPDFSERFFRLPVELDNMVAHIAGVADVSDTWITPGMSGNPMRDMKRRKPLPSRWLWADMDNAAEADSWRAIRLVDEGGFTVGSGRGPGYVHVYLKLSEPAPPDVVASLNRRLVGFLHADPSPSALNGYLRPPGSLNHKPKVLGTGEPAPVVLTGAREGGIADLDGHAVTALERALPADRKKRTTHTGNAGEETPPGDLPPEIAAILADPVDAKIDRSQRLFELVCACRRARLGDGQTVGTAKLHGPSVAKYDGRLEDEVVRILAKLGAAGEDGEEEDPPQNGGPVLAGNGPNEGPNPGINAPNEGLSPRGTRQTKGPNPAINAPNGPRLVHQLASTVKVEKPVWLWPSWLVADAVQLLVGRQGSGKSTFAAWVVAQLTSGRPWPDGAEAHRPVRCGMLSLEEPAGRLAARLRAVGADLDAVEILGDVVDYDDEGRLCRRRWQLPRDCTVLADKIAELGLAVVTIDGLGYAVHGDSHNYAVVGSALSALAGVAERTGACILGLTHPPKGRSDAVTAAIGSTAWTAIARISWVMGFDPTDEDKARRVVRPAPGSNYRLPAHGLSFLVVNHDETEAGFVTALRSSDVSAEDITSPPEPESAEELSKLGEARDFVRRTMADGPVRAAQATAAASAGGIADRTLRRARLDEGVKALNRGTVGAPDWRWEQDVSPSGQASAGGYFDDDLGQMGGTPFDQGFRAAEDGLASPSGQ